MTFYPRYNYGVTGLSASIYYRVISNITASQVIARTASGVSEDNATGIYKVGLADSYKSSAYTIQWAHGTDLPYAEENLGAYLLLPAMAQINASLVRVGFGLTASYDAAKYAASQTSVNQIDDFISMSSSSSVTFLDDFSGAPLGPEWYDGLPFNVHSVASELQRYDYQNNMSWTAVPGQLRIKTEARSVGGKSYASGCATSNRSFTYGFFEMRCKIPVTDGLFPAFWLTNDRVNTAGTRIGDAGWEIDIFEHIGEYPAAIYTNLHYGGVANHAEIGWIDAAASYTNPPADWGSDYHTFAVDWQADHLRWYIDGQMVREVTDTEQIPSVPMWIVFNAAIHENIPTTGHNLIANGTLPVYMYVDYVKVNDVSEALVYVDVREAVAEALLDYDPPTRAEVLSDKEAVIAAIPTPPTVAAITASISSKLATDHGSSAWGVLYGTGSPPVSPVNASGTTWTTRL